MRTRPLLFALVALSLAPRAARAGCCDVRKVDSESPALLLRVCEKSDGGECGAVLFQGPLELGAAARVCSADGSILYQEDLGAGLGAPIEAACDGADVEI